MTVECGTGIVFIIGVAYQATSGGSSTVALARRLNVEMPIAEKMYAVLHEGLKPQDAIDDLMDRKLKEE